MDKSEVKLMVWGRIKAAEMELDGAAAMLGEHEFGTALGHLAMGIKEIERATVLMTQHLTQKRPA